MQHTSKMVMVPEDAYSSLVRQQQQLMPPMAMQMSNLDMELKSILNNPNLTVDEKHDSYYRTFNRYNQLHGRLLNPAVVEPVVPPKQDSASDKATMTSGVPVSAKMLLDGLPKVARTRGRLLLGHLNSNKEIQWTDNGELLIDGNPIQGSNITDLLHFFTRDRPTAQPPFGAREFADQLQDTNVPAEAVVPDAFNKVGTLNLKLGTLFSPKTPKGSSIRPKKRKSVSTVGKKKKAKVEKKQVPSAAVSPVGSRVRKQPDRLGAINWEEFNID